MRIIRKQLETNADKLLQGINRRIYKSENTLCLLETTENEKYFNDIQSIKNDLRAMRSDIIAIRNEMVVTKNNFPITVKFP